MRIRTIIAASATFSLGLGVISSATAAPDEPRQRASARVAAQALTDARAVLDHDPATNVADGRDATMVLRDLLLVRNQLTGADRTAADRILSRPTQNGDDDYYGPSGEETPVCGPEVCVHYTDTGAEAVTTLTDTSPSNGVPDYVDKVLDAMEHVHTTYVAAGYRAPKSDGVLGGDARTDVYIANIGDAGLYGYCTSDIGTPPGGPYDIPAYCVLDNDYSHAEFPSNTPIENMQVTAAHEYFHAVQYAYDAAEDTWFMEATATWAEDELYDAVNDNFFYLRHGQLGSQSAGSHAGPRVSLDSDIGLNVYGNWIFFRYLTEKYGASQGGLPVLIRSMWRRADGSATGADEYSLQAVANSIAAAGGSFGKAYAGFADGNRRPAKTYSEGRSVHYPTAPLAFTGVKLTPNKPRTNWGSIRLNHLTSATASFKPKQMQQKSWKLKLSFDMADRSRGSMAVVSVYYKNGKVKTSSVSLSSKGKGAKKVPFSSAKVKSVEATLVNASTRTSCWTDGTGTTYSCLGTPSDDNQTEKLQASASR